MNGPPAILVVCLGNICRSPLAEGALRAAAERRGIDLQVDSAGLGRWHAGERPDRRARAVAQRAGVDISGQRARQVTGADFGRFDLILAVDSETLDELERLRPPGAAAELSLLLDMVPGRKGHSVADPYYGEEAGFETAWRDVSEAAEALLDRLT